MTDLKIHHLGVAVADIEQALKFYQQAFGFVVRSGPFDDPIQRVRVCFLGPAQGTDSAIELIEALSDDSPITRTLAKGIGAYHICCEVDDLTPTVAALLQQGCTLVNPPVPATAFGGRRIAWFFTPTNHLMEIVERRPA